MSQRQGIEIKEATKRFNDSTVFHDVTLSAEPGKITGIIGRNGSGKTVLFKCICGFLPLTSGTVTVGGEEINPAKGTPKDMGIIIEAPGFLPQYSGMRNLKFLAQIQNSIDEQRLRTAMDLVGLDWQNKTPVGKYSLGMRQRLGIAQAIMEEQTILIMDEPMNGLDERGAHRIRSLLLFLKGKDKTLLIASHNLKDIDMMCDHVYEISDGVVRSIK